MLVADGQAHATERRPYVPAGDLHDLAVPETLTALIAARLDALEPPTERWSRTPRCWARASPPAASRRCRASTEDALESRLRASVRRELLPIETDPRSPERGQYAFIQALIREVAYNTLSRRDRKARHLAAARYFERLGSDELAGALAGHYLAAQQNASEGPEADALAAQARIALRAAAERAMRWAPTIRRLHSWSKRWPSRLSPSIRRICSSALPNRPKSPPAPTSPDACCARLFRHLAGCRRQACHGARASRARSDPPQLAPDQEASLELLEAADREFGDLWPDPVIASVKGNLARAVGQFDDARRAIGLADEVLEVAERGKSSEPVGGDLNC